ncbi:hypothetical protein BHE74_00030490, partial [Ensete ventricosum]
ALATSLRPPLFLVASNEEKGEDYFLIYSIIPKFFGYRRLQPSTKKPSRRLVVKGRHRLRLSLFLPCFSLFLAVANTAR